MLQFCAAARAAKARVETAARRAIILALKMGEGMQTRGLVLEGGSARSERRRVRSIAAGPSLSRGAFYAL